MTLSDAEQGIKHVIYEVMDMFARKHPNLVEAWANKRLMVDDVEGVIIDHVDHEFEIHACSLVLK